MDLKVTVLLFIFSLSDFGLCAPSKDRTDSRTPSSDGNLDNPIIVTFGENPGDLPETDSISDGEDDNTDSDNIVPTDPTETPPEPDDADDNPNNPQGGTITNPDDNRGVDSTDLDNSIVATLNPTDPESDQSEKEGDPDKSSKVESPTKLDNVVTDDTPVEPAEEIVHNPDEDAGNLGENSNTEAPTNLDIAATEDTGTPVEPEKVESHSDEDSGNANENPNTESSTIVIPPETKEENKSTVDEHGGDIDSKEDNGVHASESPPEASDNDLDNQDDDSKTDQDSGKIDNILTTTPPQDEDSKNDGDDESDDDSTSEKDEIDQDSSPVSTESPPKNNDTIIDEGNLPNDEIIEDNTLNKKNNDTNPSVSPETKSGTPIKAVLTTRSVPETSRTPPSTPYYTQYYNPLGYSRLPPYSSSARYPTTGGPMYPYRPTGPSYPYPINLPSSLPYYPTKSEVPIIPDNYQTTGGNLVQTEAETTAEIETNEIVATATVTEETTKPVLIAQETTTTPITTTIQPTTQPIVTTTTMELVTTTKPVEMPGMPPSEEEPTESPPKQPDETVDVETKPEVTEPPPKQPKEDDHIDDGQPEEPTTTSTPEEGDHNRGPPGEQTGREGGSKVPNEDEEEPVKSSPSPTSTTKPVFKDITATTSEQSKGLLEKIKKASEDVVKQFGALKVSLVLLLLITVSFLSIFFCCKLCKKKGYRMRQRRLKEYGQEKEFLLRDRKRSNKYNNDTVTLLEGSSEDEF